MSIPNDSVHSCILADNSSWSHRHPLNWSSCHVMSWLQFVIRETQQDPSTFNSSAFSNRTGLDLSLMTESQFTQLDGHFGKFLFMAFNRLQPMQTALKSRQSAVTTERRGQLQTVPQALPPQMKRDAHMVPCHGKR